MQMKAGCCGKMPSSVRGNDYTYLQCFFRLISVTYFAVDMQ